MRVIISFGLSFKTPNLPFVYREFCFNYIQRERLSFLVFKLHHFLLSLVACSDSINILIIGISCINLIALVTWSMSSLWLLQGRLTSMLCESAEMIYCLSTGDGSIMFIGFLLVVLVNEARIIAFLLSHICQRFWLVSSHICLLYFWTRIDPFYLKQWALNSWCMWTN